MIISDNAKFVLIQAPNTGSRTTRAWLRTNIDTTIPSEDELKGTWKAYNPMVSQYDADYLAQIKTYKVVMVVRNPFRRAVSVWARLTNAKEEIAGYGTMWTTFEEWLDFQISGLTAPTDAWPFNCWNQPDNWRVFQYNSQDTWFAMQHTQYYFYDNVLSGLGHIDNILHLETLETDLQTLFSNTAKVETIGASGVDWTAYNTTDILAKVKKWCPDDYSEVLGYA